ncbi:MAG: VanZ family protein [Pyrinomonadaceae bacterium]
MSAENQENPNWRGRFWRYAPLILWIGLILFASSRAGAMSNTSLFIRPLLRFLFPDAPEETLLVYHAYIRKCAHLTEYAGLGFWASRFFWTSSRRFLEKYWFAAAFVLVLAVASVDEFNQSFNPARTGAFRDVLLDCFGGLVMICLLGGYRTYRGRKAERN